MTNVLVVEDNFHNMALVEQLLLSCGFSFEGASNGEVALSKCDKMVYDLILMDIELPDANGVELTRMIRNNPGYLNIPVIALTAYVMDGEKERFLSLGFDGYLSKPIDFDVFFEMIEKYRK